MAQACHIVVVLVPWSPLLLFMFMARNMGKGPNLLLAAMWVLLAAMRVLLVDGASSTLATLAVVVVAMASCRSILALFTAANWAGSGALGADWPAVVRGRMTAVMGALGQL